MPADLSKKATYERMVSLPLEPTRASEEGLESAGREPTTDPAEFEGRGGYRPDFLDGWEVDLPKPTKGDRVDDMRPLRRGGAGVELKYEHFSVIMSKSRRLPMITACNIDGKKSRNLPRITTWSFDGRLDEDDQLGDALYDGNDLDRGHMVRREDPVWGAVKIANRANEDTFHFTNSCPQMAHINQVVWLGLENYVLNHTREDDMKVSVFTGPFFSEKDLRYRQARIPLSFWKVVAIVTEDGRPSATAYRVGQEKELEELEYVFGGYKTFQISIQQVMEGTGIDFSALLEYDGLTEHERTTGRRQEELLETLSQVKV
jgi:endonuclease G, mitochondrial